MAGRPRHRDSGSGVEACALPRHFLSALFGLERGSNLKFQEERVASKRMLLPGDGHGRGRAMVIAPNVPGAILEVGDKAGELFDGFFVSDATFFGGGQFGFAQDTGIGIAAGPGDERGGSGGEEIDPIEGVVFFVKTDRAIFDLIMAHIFVVEVHVQGGFQLAGMSAPAGEFALTPFRKEGFVDGQEVPPGSQDAIGIGFEVGAAGDQIEVWHVRAMSVEQKNSFEPVVSE